MRFGGLIAAIVFAAIAAVIVLRMSAIDQTQPLAQQAQVQQAPALKTTNVFVAATTIPIGTAVTAEMVAIQPWPEHLVLESFIKAEGGLGSVVGRVTRSAFQPQEPLINSKLANANDPNFIAGALPKGMRVITIQTNEIEGVAGFVFPGDYVDVLLTHDVDKYVTEPGPNGATQPPRKDRETITENLLNNVKVIAVDQRATGAAVVDANGRSAIPRSISLMVVPADAQKLRLGAQKGTLTLQLRSLADRETTDPLLVTTPRDLTQLPDPAQGLGAGDNSTVTVVRGVSSASTPVGLQNANGANGTFTSSAASKPPVTSAPKL